MKKEIKFIIIDLFCGAGGTTTGFEKSEVAKVIACVNHDPIAIKSHQANHPEMEHFAEDILTIDMNLLINCVKRAKDKYPNAKLIIWASLECTHFSNARGGKERNEDSRTLAWGLLRYIEALNPEYVQIENVREFMSWGPLTKDGKPVSKTKGKDWLQWRHYINENFNYYDDWTLLNSADFGANTSRVRLFGCFAKKHLPIKFPKQTHVKELKGDMFSELKKWKPVKECLDLENEGKSIFERKTPLVDSTLIRILAGINKFVIPMQETNFLIKYNSMNKNGKYSPPSIKNPSPVIATQERLGLVKIEFIDTYYSGNPNSKVRSVDSPSGTITTIDHHSKVCCVMSYHGTTKNLISSELPSPTITAADTLGVTHIVYNPSYGSHTHSIEKPCPVIVARQDKAPLSLITCKMGKFQIPIYDDDSKVMIEIKHLMVKYGIIDIKTRMFTVEEKLKIQGFPSDYTLFGRNEDKGKFIGNSVTPVIPQMWANELARYI